MILAPDADTLTYLLTYLMLPLLDFLLLLVYLLLFIACVCVTAPSTLLLSLKQRIKWSLNALTDQGIVLPFSGIPFIFLGNRTLSCHHGPDLNKSSKIKQQDSQVAKSVSGLTVW